MDLNENKSTISPEEFEKIILEFKDSIYRFSLRMCRNPGDAEEILQETFLSAFRNFHKFRGDASIKTWLFTIAANACRMKRRKLKKDSRNTSLWNPKDMRDNEGEYLKISNDDPGMEDALTREQLVSAVIESIGLLSPIYRETIVLRDMEGLSTRESAHALGLTERALKTRLARARAMVRKKVGYLLETQNAL